MTTKRILDLRQRRKRARALMCAWLACAAAAFSQEAPNPLNVLTRTLAKIDSPEAQANILRGMNATLKGRTGIAAPEGWDALYERLRQSPNAEVRDLSQSLGATFGSRAVFGEMRKVLADAKAPVAERKTAIESLSAAKDSEAFVAILDLLKESSPVRLAALRALSRYDDGRVASTILSVFPNLAPEEKPDAFATLLGRTGNARVLLAAIDAGAMQRTEITAPLARQLAGLNDAQVSDWLAKNWGAVKSSTADKQNEIARYKKFLGAEQISRADLNRGRALFTQTCAACHTMHGQGGNIGPELPGAFEDVDYLLQNILDPNAIIGKDYQQAFVTTKDGQILSGIVAGEDDGGVTLKTLGAPVTVQRANIAEMKLSEFSMMPEGLLTALDEQAVRDLFLYLRQKQDVVAPANDAKAPHGGDASLGEDGSFVPPAASFRVAVHFGAALPLGRGDGGGSGTKWEWDPSGAHIARWREIRGELELRLEVGVVEEATALRVTVSNGGAEPAQRSLSVAVQPKSQDGATIYGLSFERHAFFVEGRPVVVAEAPSRGAVLSANAFDARPFSPALTASVQSARGECRGEMVYDLAIPAHGAVTLDFVCPAGADGGVGDLRKMKAAELFDRAATGAISR